MSDIREISHFIHCATEEGFLDFSTSMVLSLYLKRNFRQDHGDGQDDHDDPYDDNAVFVPRHDAPDIFNQWLANRPRS